MVDPRIKKDIENWADEKLRLWLKDVVTRHEISGSSEQEAFASATATMMMFTALIVASSAAEPRESGEVFMSLVAHLKRKLRMLEDEQVQREGDSELSRRSGKGD